MKRCAGRGVEKLIACTFAAEMISAAIMSAAVCHGAAGNARSEAVRFGTGFTVPFFILIAFAVLLVAAMGMLISSLLFKNWLDSRQKWALIDLSVFILLMDGWLVCSSAFAGLTVCSAAAARMLSFLFLSLAPIAYLLYMERIIIHYRSWITAFTGIFCLLYLANVTLALLRGFTLPNTLVLFQAIAAAGLVMCMTVCTLAYFRHGQKQYVEISVGNALFLAGMLIELILHRVGASAQNGYTYYFALTGLLLFVTLVCAGQMRSLVQTLERGHAAEQLRLSEEEFRIVVGKSDTFVMRYDVGDATLYQHADAAKYFGLPEVVRNAPERLIDAENVVAPDSAADVREFFDRMNRLQREGSVTVRLKPAGLGPNAYRWYRMDFTMVFDKDGAARHGVISLRDVTEQRAMEFAYERIREETARIPVKRMVSAECNLDRDMIESLTGELLDVPDTAYNGRYSELIHNEADRMEPDAHRKLLTALDRENLLAAYYKGRRRVSLETIRHFPDDSRRWVRYTVQLVRPEGATEVMAFLVVTDIDRQKNEQRLIEKRLTHDSLTGVLNRSTFVERVQELLATKPEQHVAILMLDVDSFKEVNDMLGHDVGDAVIAETAQKICGILRADDIVGRFGGDEFIMCLPNVPNEGIVIRRAEQLCTALNRTIEQNGRHICISASIGIAMYPQDGTAFDDLLRNADKALYFVKAAGKNGCALFRPKMEHGDYIGKETRSAELFGNPELPADMNNLLRAVARHYPLIVTCNLSQDHYRVLESSGAGIPICGRVGVYHELLRICAQTLHAEDQAALMQELDRERLINAFQHGKHTVALPVRQLQSDGAYCRMGIEVQLFAGEAGDVRAVILIGRAKAETQQGAPA